MTAPSAAALLDLTRGFLPDAAAVVDVAMLAGGSSREIWGYTAETPAGRHDLVLRRDPGAGGPDPGWADLQLDRLAEHAVLAAAHRGGVTVATPRVAFRDPGGLGEGLVTDRVAGSADPRTVLAGPCPDALLARLGAELAAVHAIDLDGVPLPPPSAEAHEEPWRRRIDGLGLTSPVLELALLWLGRHRPSVRPPVLVHGDFRVGNLMVEADLTAVLDWEGAHIGQPGEDLGWFCVPAWQFGRPDRPAGGLGGVDALLAAYRAAGGASVGPDEVRWWQVLGTLRWCVLCHMMAHLHRSGVRPSLELAAIGRRAVENEVDLLDLMDIS